MKNNKNYICALEKKLSLMIKTQCDEIGCKECTLHIYDNNNKKVSCDVCELENQINTIKYE